MLNKEKVKSLDIEYREDNFICIPFNNASDVIDEYIDYYKKLGNKVIVQFLMSEIWIIVK